MAARAKKPAPKKAPEHAARDEQLRSSFDIPKTKSDRVAILITNALGSIKFLCACIALFAFYIAWNLGFLPGLVPFDHFPFPGLEMVVSVFAIILSVSVLISQNRQGRLEKIKQQVEFEVNVRAENEITKVLAMLHEIQKKMGINTNDIELEEMKESLDISQLHNKVDEQKL